MFKICFKIILFIENAIEILKLKTPGLKLKWKCSELSKISYDIALQHNERDVENLEEILINLERTQIKHKQQES